MEMHTGASVMALALLFYMLLDSASAQENFQVLTGANIPVLAQNPDLLDVAAISGERVLIEITSPEATVIVQEDVNVVIDCTPWLMRFPGGSVRWYLTVIDPLMGQPLLDDDGLPLDEIRIVDGVNIRILGEFNQILNVTRTEFRVTSADPTAGTYRCEVSVPPLIDGDSSDCSESHSANTTMFVLGKMPVLDSTDDVNAGPVNFFVDPRTPIYLVGSNFCLNEIPTPSVDDRAAIMCTLTNVSQAEVFPEPTRSWSLNGVVVYTDTGPEDVNPVVTDEFNTTYPGLISLLTLRFDGGIVINADVINITDAMVMAYQFVFGTWRCEAGNIYGNDSAETVIQTCVSAPQLNKSLVTTVVETGTGVPIGCNVCLQQDERVTDNTVNFVCNPGGATPPLDYIWSLNNMVVREYRGVNASQTELVGNRAGNYTCRVENVENFAEQTSILYFVPGVEISATITTVRGRVISGDQSCSNSRFRIPPANITFCLLVGETVQLFCQFSSDSNGLPEPTIINVDSNVSISMEAQSNFSRGNYSCGTMHPQCGQVEDLFSVAVYEPARINRVVPLPTGVLGAGRSVSATVVVTGSSATLYCPTMGNPDPITTWRRFVYNEFGRASEQQIETGGEFTIR